MDELMEAYEEEWLDDGRCEDEGGFCYAHPRRLLEFDGYGFVCVDCVMER